MMYTKPLVILLVCLIFAMVLSTPLAVAADPPDDGPRVKDFKPPLTFDDQGPAPKTGRVMVVTDGPLTETMREELRKHGKIHGVIHRHNIVAITPKGEKGGKAIEELPFVSFTEIDQPRYLTGVGSWDRDIIDVVDVDESGEIGGPDDPREVAQTGAGVYVAVIDTGLINNWRDFLDENKVNTDLALAFTGGGATTEDFVPTDDSNTTNPPNLWERDTNSHGTAVASHVIGFKADPLVVDGVAPNATIIPLKVFPNGQAHTWSSPIIAAIAYVTTLKENGQIGPVVINMSLGGPEPSVLERLAIQNAINSGVIVVSSAGNEGESGMSWAAAYPEVISVGAIGWTQQLQPVTDDNYNRDFWWNLDVDNDPDGTGLSEEEQAYVADFSSRAIPELGQNFGVGPQELDVLAPGVGIVVPYDHGPKTSLVFLVGTSLSSPLTAGVAALMLEKNPDLAQTQVEGILKDTALDMNPNNSRPGVFDPFFGGFYEPSWDDDCDGLSCDPVGSGLLQADAALNETPSP